MCVCTNVDAGMGAVDVAILDAHGNKDTARPTITQKADGVWLVEYSATAPGTHSVNVFFAGKSIPNSPFGVVVSPGLTFWTYAVFSLRYVFNTWFYDIIASFNTQWSNDIIQIF